MKTRQRCALGTCRHAPRAHTEDGCTLCECPAWLDTKTHTWRTDVTDAWFLATHAWLLAREAASNGYATEMDEFEEHHPRPRLADFMRAMSPGVAPEVLADLIHPTVCPTCQGTGHQRGSAA